jgi:hypothetical protein
MNINEGRELCIKLVIYKNFTEMHGQQNIKSVISWGILELLGGSQALDKGGSCK